MKAADALLPLARNPAGRHHFFPPQPLAAPVLAEGPPRLGLFALVRPVARALRWTIWQPARWQRATWSTILVSAIERRPGCPAVIM